VRWPSGLTERFDNALVGEINTLKEGTGVKEKEAISNKPSVFFLRP
jgi:hypothetical protein